MPSDAVRGISLLFLVLCSCHHASPTPDVMTDLTAPAESLVAQAAIVMHDGGDKHVFLPVTVHGHAATVLLDLGEDFNILDPDLLAQFGVPSTDRPLIVDSLVLGDATEHQVAVNADAFIIAAPLQAPIARLGMPPFLGVLGTPILAHYDLVVDGPAHQVRLYRPPPTLRAPDASSQASDSVAMWFPPGMTAGDCVPMRDESGDSQFPLFTLSVNGHAVLGNFDSGAAFNAMNMAAAKALGLTQHTPGVRQVDASHNVAFPGGAPSPIQYDLAGSNVAVGMRHLPNQTIRILPHYPIRQIALVALGLDAFRDRIVFVAYNRRQVCVGAPRIAQRAHASRRAVASLQPSAI